MNGLRRHEDISFNTKAREALPFAAAMHQGKQVVFNNQPCLVLRTIERRELINDVWKTTSYDIVLRPIGPPVAPLTASQVKAVGDGARLCYATGRAKYTGYLANAIEQERRHFTDRIKKTISEELHSYVTTAQAEAYYAAAVNREFPPSWPAALSRTLGLAFDAQAFEKAMAPLLKKEKPLRIRNKFYIAAPAVTTPFEQDQVNTAGEVSLAVHTSTANHRWTRPTLKDAIAHAETMLEQDPKREHVAIVQIVRIVRRKKQPVVIETVK